MMVQQICDLLDLLGGCAQCEREGLLEGCPRFLFEVEELLGVLDGIVGGSACWGWGVGWGCRPWRLVTYRRWGGLALRAGWEDGLDFGLDLYRDAFEASLGILMPMLSPRVLAPIDLGSLGVRDAELDLPTDVCGLTHMEHGGPVLFHGLVSGGSVGSSGVVNNGEALGLPVADGGSGIDSMPELEDETNLDSVEIPLWLIPNWVIVTFRRGRVIFEREQQGPPWQDVLAQMLEEQNSMLGDN